MDYKVTAAHKALIELSIMKLVSEINEVCTVMPMMLAELLKSAVPPHMLGNIIAKSVLVGQIDAILAGFASVASPTDDMVKMGDETEEELIQFVVGVMRDRLNAYRKQHGRSMLVKTEAEYQQMKQDMKRGK